MSEIFQDGAGNKYLGDCRWGNHDIDYPTNNHPLSIGDTSGNAMWADIRSLLVSKGFTSTSSIGTVWNNSTSNGTVLLSGIAPSKTHTFQIRNGYYYGSWPAIWANNVRLGENIITSSYSHKGYLNANDSLNDYCAMCSSSGIGISMWKLNATKNGFLNIYYSCFVLFSYLVDINTEFNYYSGQENRQYIALNCGSNGFNLLTSNLTLEKRFNHYVTAEKPLLETGRAAYTISCSDGQTPGSQGATDMWVYDNNATFGYPVIGRVPNMLLGVGTYTYLKPVKIQGSVFPDNGSPWYLPVGTFSGKTLLMRCYSSMS